MRGCLKYLILNSLLISLLVPVCFGHIQDRSKEYNGIILTYLNDSVRKKLDQSDFHEKLGTKVAYQAKLIPVDFILSKNSKENHDPVSLDFLCAQYLKNREILRCERNRRTQVDQPGIPQPDIDLSSQPQRQNSVNRAGFQGLPVVFETDRVIIRPVAAGDEEGMIRVMTNRENIQQSGSEWNRTQAARLVRVPPLLELSNNGKFTNFHGYSVFSIVLKEDLPNNPNKSPLESLPKRGDVIGYFDFRRIQGDEQKNYQEALQADPSSGSIAIGYALDRRAQQRGIMTDVVKSVLSGLWQHRKDLNITDIYADALNSNDASQKVLAKTGFEPVTNHNATNQPKHSHGYSHASGNKAPSTYFKLNPDLLSDSASSLNPEGDIPRKNSQSTQGNSAIMQVLQNVTALPKEVDHALSPPISSCRQENLSLEQILHLFDQDFGKLHCQVFDSHPGIKEYPLEGIITPFWAQEAIGADFAKEFIENQKKLFPHHQRVPVSVVDSGFLANTLPPDRVNPEALKAIVANTGDHGTGVTQIIGGNTPAATSNVVYFQHLEDGRYTDTTIQSLDNISKVPSKILNISLGLSSWTLLDNLNKVSQKTLIVLSAGNDYPQPIPPLKERISSEVILVSSLSPLGFTSEFSSPSSPGGITIAAPADYSQLSVKDTSLNFKGFGGTSGAAAAVSGALANAAFFLPNLTLEEAKILLEMTATPVPMMGRPQNNGNAMLNAYRLALVAERLSKRPEWKNLSNTEKRLYLYSHNILDFDGSAAQFYKEAVDLLAPPGGIDSLSHPEKCQREKEALLHLRKVILLTTPYDSVFRDSVQLLKSIYSSQGLKYNAMFYDGLVKATDSSQKEYLAEAIKDPNPQIRSSALRAAMEKYPNDFPKLWQSSMNHRHSQQLTLKDWGITFRALQYAEQQQDSALLLDLLQLQMGNGNSLLSFVRSTRNMGLEDSDLIYRALLKVVDLSPHQAVQLLQMKNEDGKSPWDFLSEEDRFKIWSCLEDREPGLVVNSFPVQTYITLRKLQSSDQSEVEKYLDSLTELELKTLVEKKESTLLDKIVRKALDTEKWDVLYRLLKIQDQAGDNWFSRAFDRFNDSSPRWSRVNLAIDVITKIAQGHPTQLEDLLKEKNQRGFTGLGRLETSEVFKILQILDEKNPTLAKNLSPALVGLGLESLTFTRNNQYNGFVQKYLKIMSPEDRLRVLTGQYYYRGEYCPIYDASTRKGADLSPFLIDYDPKALIASLKVTDRSQHHPQHALYNTVYYENKEGAEQILTAVVKVAPDSLYELLHGWESKRYNHDHIPGVVGLDKVWFKDLLRKVLQQHAPQLSVEELMKKRK